MAQHFIRKFVTTFLAITIAAASIITITACDKKPKDLAVTDGIFNKNCAFALDLDHESTMHGYDGLALFMIQIVYGPNETVYKIMTEATKPREQYEERNVYFYPDGRCVLYSKYSEIIRNYHDTITTGAPANEETIEGAYRIEATDTENIYAVNTSLNSLKFTYDSVAKTLTGSNIFLEEKYDADETLDTPTVKPVTFDYSAIEAGGEKEAKYLARGSHEVSTDFYREKENKAWYGYKIWYPTDINESKKKIPLVVMANGTGTPYNKYEYVFEHLASWGFIVIGNDADNSGTGEPSDSSLQLMISLNSDKKSKFYNKVDLEHVGSAGHSQGGAGAVNAVLRYDRKNNYKAIYSASNTNSDLSDTLGWGYNPAEIKIPYFGAAGETDSLATMESYQKIYNGIGNSAQKVIACRLGAGHEQMKTWGDGYMVAWFLWHLQGDKRAMLDFRELFKNQKWIDVQKNFD